MSHYRLNLDRLPPTSNNLRNKRLRKRSLLACTSCRDRKIRCVVPDSGHQRCSNCIKLRQECVFHRIKRNPKMPPSESTSTMSNSAVQPAIPVFTSPRSSLFVSESTDPLLPAMNKQTSEPPLSPCFYPTRLGIENTRLLPSLSRHIPSERPHECRLYSQHFSTADGLWSHAYELAKAGSGDDSEMCAYPYAADGLAEYTWTNTQRQSHAGSEQSTVAKTLVPTNWMSLPTENEPGYEGELFSIEGDADNEISKKKSKEQPPEAIYKKKLISGRWDDLTRIINVKVKELQERDCEVTWSSIPDGRQAKAVQSILNELESNEFPEAEEREKAVANILKDRLRRRKYDGMSSDPLLMPRANGTSETTRKTKVQEKKAEENAQKEEEENAGLLEYHESMKDQTPIDCSQKQQWQVPPPASRFPYKTMVPRELASAPLLADKEKRTHSVPDAQTIDERRAYTLKQANLFHRFS